MNSFSTRIWLIAGAAALIGAPLTAKPAPKRAVAAAPLRDTPEVQALRRTFLYAFPVYEMMRTRARAVQAGGVNRLVARKSLADATSREVTTPNNDTLYASAWLDLSNGPVTLTVPDLGDRYGSAALMNIFTDNVAVLGKAGKFTIAGPGYTGKPADGATLVKAASNDAWLLVRVYANGAPDVVAAGTALDGFVLEGGGAPVATTMVPTATPDARTFLTVVDEALRRSAIEPRLPTAWAKQTPARQKLWATALPTFRRELRNSLAKTGSEVDGWSYPGPGIGNFGDDDEGRAAAALGGIGALPRSEAVYLTARGAGDGAPLTGDKAYTVHIPPKPPAGAFWSLSLYEVQPDGRLFFVPNPDNRFSLGSGSKTTHLERDGSLDIFVQATRPAGERWVNWLPAPKGSFRLIWRAYRPGPALLDGSFRLPPVVVSEAIP